MILADFASHHFIGNRIIRAITYLYIYLLNFPPFFGLYAPQQVINHYQLKVYYSDITNIKI